MKLTKDLANPSFDVISFTEYLNIQAIYVKMNTGLPAIEQVRNVLEALSSLFFVKDLYMLNGLYILSWQCF